MMWIQPSAYVPTSCWLSEGFSPFDTYFLVLYAESLTILAVVDECPSWKILISVNITLGIHQFCDDISCQLCYCSPMKLYFIKTYFKNEVMIGFINWFTISITHFVPYLESNISVFKYCPPTLRLLLVLHPMWGTSQHFVIHPHMDHTAVCLLSTVLLGLPS